METEAGQPQGADVSDQAIVDRLQGALFPKAEKPREPSGKFAKAEAVSTQEEPPPPEEEEAPVGENAQIEGDDAPQEELAWENVKDVKLKLPLKNGAEEWEQEVSLEDLRLGYMRQDDYQRKTQEVSQQRARSQEEVRQATSTLRQQAIAELSTYEQALFGLVAPQFKNVDMNRLAAENPAEWAQLRQTQENFNAILYQLRTQKQQLEQASTAEQQQSRAQAVAQATDELQRVIPNWGPELDQALAKMATSDYGFRPEELAQGYVPIADARVMRMAHDAYQWRQLQSQKPVATKRVAEAPKVLKPGAKRDPKQDLLRRTEAMKTEVRKTGGKGATGEAALAALIKQRMYGG
jgi:hypothetical protein